MNIRYKLTDANMQTYGGFQWTLGEWKEVEGKGKNLCSEDFLHCYSDPLLAILLAPLHVSYSTLRIFRCGVRGGHAEDKGLKEGWKKMILTEEIPLPEVSTKQRIAFGILCAKEVCKDTKWNAWADAWLSGEDRSKEAAWAAWAAGTAGAAQAARAAGAGAVAVAAAWEAQAATAEAARAAAQAGAQAAEVVKTLDLRALASRAMEYK